VRTIQQIQKLKNENKKKWGFDLIKFCIPYIKDGFSNEEIIQMLLSDFNINISLNSFKNLRFRYYKKLTQVDSLNSVSQNKEAKTEETIDYTTPDFEFIDYDDPKYIVESQKRRRDALFSKKGAKW
ncbi:MAG: hypothetical protein ACK4YV_15425, partial [Emticicia sp.]